MNMKVCRVFTFEAAHRLPRHEGKCKRPHGHSYRMEVEVEGPVQEAKIPGQGMVVDFSAIKTIVKEEIIDRVDHQDLNKVILFGYLEEPGSARVWTPVYPDMDNVTTAERLAAFFANLLRHRFATLGLRLTRVRISEQADSWAEWTANA